MMVGVRMWRRVNRVMIEFNEMFDLAGKNQVSAAPYFGFLPAPRLNAPLYDEDGRNKSNHAQYEPGNDADCTERRH
jgi:hypothetical protein